MVPAFSFGSCTKYNSRQLKTMPRRQALSARGDDLKEPDDIDTFTVQDVSGPAVMADPF
jgi:hypothetical protein